jgi:hypothetical protein
MNNPKAVKTQRIGLILSAACNLYLYAFLGGGYLSSGSFSHTNLPGGIGRGLACLFGFLAVLSFLYMLLPRFRQSRPALFLGGVANLCAVYLFEAANNNQTGWPVMLSLAGALVFALLYLLAAVRLKPAAEGEDGKQPVSRQ